MLHFDLIGSTGVVLPGTESKIVDPSTGKALGPHQRGEVQVRVIFYANVICTLIHT